MRALRHASRRTMGAVGLCQCWCEQQEHCIGCTFVLRQPSAPIVVAMGAAQWCRHWPKATTRRLFRW